MTGTKEKKQTIAEWAKEHQWVLDKKTMPGLFKDSEPQIWWEVHKRAPGSSWDQKTLIRKGYDEARRFNSGKVRMVRSSSVSAEA